VRINKLNNFNIIFPLLIIFSVTGSATYLGIQQLQFFRLVLIISSLYIIFQVVKNNTKINNVLFLYISWLFLYYFLSLVSSLVNYMSLSKYETDINSFINFTIILLFNINLIYFLNKNHEKFIQILYKTVVFLFLLMLIISLYEIIWQAHLSPSKAYFQSLFTSLHYQPATFFSNPNDFMAVLTLMIVFIVGYNINRNNMNYILLYSFILFGLILSFITGSRIATLSILSILAILLFNTKIISWKFAVLSLFFLIIALYNINTNIQIIDTISSFSLGGNSTEVRKELYKSAIFLIEEKYFFGVGINNSSIYYDLLNNSNLSGAINPHNYLLEILINSGALVMLSYLLLNTIFIILFIKIKMYYLVYMLFIYQIILISSSSSIFLWFHYIYYLSIIALYLVKIKNNYIRNYCVDNFSEIVVVGKLKEVYKNAIIENKEESNKCKLK